MIGAIDILRTHISEARYGAPGFSLIETILPEWGLVWAWRKAIQSLRLLLRSGPFDCAQGRVVGHAGVGCVARLKPGPSDCFPGRQVASLTRVVFPGLRPRL